MWWYRKGNSGDSWLPEEKKANMWYGRGNSSGSWPPAFPPLVRGGFRENLIDFFLGRGVGGIVSTSLILIIFHYISADF